MPCHAAMTGKLVTVTPDDTVEDVLKAMKKAQMEAVPVVDKQGKLLGLFSYAGLIRNLLPVNVAMSSGIQLDVKIAAAPGIAKRLKKMEVVTAGEMMDRTVVTVHPETPLWEGVNLLVQQSQPLVVVEAESNKVLGVITGQSAIDELNRLKDSEG